MPGDRPASEQQVGGVLGSRQLAAQYPVERRRLQIVTQRARLLDTAFGKGVGACPLYSPSTLAFVSPWRTSHNFMMHSVEIA